MFQGGVYVTKLVTNLVKLLTGDVIPRMTDQVCGMAVDERSAVASSQLADQVLQQLPLLSNEAYTVQKLISA